MKKKALGRGLRALIPDTPPSVTHKHALAVHTLPTASIRANPYQPRQQMDATKLQELASSIHAKGLMQPIIVRRRPDGYELVAGERRLRAVQSLGYTEVPAIVREEISDQESLELSLLENIQRDDLNPVEEAEGYQRLVHEFGLTQEHIAHTVGKDRSTVANALRLLKLSPMILDALRARAITMGHAKALLAVEDEHERQRLFDELLRRGSSVREVELKAAHAGTHRRAAARRASRDPHITAVEDELATALGTRVRLIHGRRRGRIVIEYYSLEDLERIRQALHGQRSLA